MIFRGLCVLASWLLVVASSDRGPEEDPSPATGVQRQFIGSQGIGQNPFSQAPPFSPPLNGMFGGMNDAQPNANQMQLLAAMQKDPRTRQQISGLLQQMGGSPGGIGQPLGQNAFNTEENTLMTNPITAPNGLTKDVLKSLMMGNVGDFSPPQFSNRMGYSSNDMMNSFSNGPSSFQDPRKLESLVNSFSNQPAGSEGLPMFPKFNFGGQSQDHPLLHARHHHRHGHIGKAKSDTVTKLLLSLLVDKLKDIYEMDKYTANGARKQKLQNQETTGKIGSELQSDGDQSNQTVDAMDQKKKGTFQTNLTFPLTVSDPKSTGIKLVDATKTGAKKDKSDFELDSASIDKIIKGIEANQTRLNPDPSKPVVKTGVNRELKDDGFVLAESTHPGLETAEKNDKVLEKEEFVKNPDTGSFAEFHTIKMPLESDDRNGTKPPPDDQPVETEEVKAMLPMDGHEVEKVTSLPSFSVSSLLNKGKSQSVAATDRVLSPDSLQSFQDMSSSSTEASSPKDPLSKSEDASEPTKEAGDDYLEASRVLGSVYNRVKDPLAKKSVETAIKAMLKLLRSDSSYSKKEDVPSAVRLTNSVDDEGTDNRLRMLANEKRNRAVKKAAKKRVKVLKNVVQKAQRRGGSKINTRAKFKESQLKSHKRPRRERMCACEKPLTRVLKRKRKSTRSFENY